MVSQDSNVDSSGYAIDLVGGRLEDPPLDFLLADPLFLGSNPAFTEDAPHGESAPIADPVIRSGLLVRCASSDSKSESNSDIARSPVSSNRNLSPTGEIAAARAAESSAIFKAALQINSNEREAGLASAKRALDLQKFILNKGHSIAEVNDFLNGLSSQTPCLSRDEFGLPVLNKATLNPPSAIAAPVDAHGASAKSWSNVVQATPKEAEITLDYCPMPQGSAIISPPSEVLKKGIDKFKCSLVGTFTKGSLAFQRVAELTHNAWSPRGLIHVSQKNNKQFIFKFKTVVDMNSVLARGTWYFDKKPMVVKAWGCSTPIGSIKNMPLWVKFSQLPDYYWTREGLSFLASGIGKPLCVDQLTAQLSPVQFAKICVSYHIGDPLPDSLTVATIDPDTGEQSTTEISVSYPQKPMVCSGCHSLGHSAAVCPLTKRIWVKKTPEPLNNDPGTSSKQTVFAGCSSTQVPLEKPDAAGIVITEEAWTTVKRKGKPQQGLDRGFCIDLSPSPLLGFKHLKNVDEIEAKHRKSNLMLISQPDLNVNANATTSGLNADSTTVNNTLASGLIQGSAAVLVPKLSKNQRKKLKRSSGKSPQPGST